MSLEQNNPYDFINNAASWSQYLANRLNAEKGFGERLAQDIQTPLCAETVDNYLKAAFSELQTLTENEFQQLKHSDLRELKEHAKVAELLSIDNCKLVLRQVRKRVFCALAVRDICHLAPLEEVLSTISYFADVAVQIAYRAAMLQLITRHGLSLIHI